MKTVLIFGTFDFLHAGHLSLIKKAKTHGERLVAVIARDETVKKIKGKAPIHTEADRKYLVQSIRYVDEAIFGNKKDVYQVIRRIRPDVIVLGYDQQAFVNNLEKKIHEYKLNTKIVRLKKYKSYKSTQIKNIDNTLNFNT